MGIDYYFYVSDERGVPLGNREKIPDEMYTDAWTAGTYVHRPNDGNTYRALFTGQFTIKEIISSICGSDLTEWETRDEYGVHNLLQYLLSGEVGTLTKYLKMVVDC